MRTIVCALLLLSGCNEYGFGTPKDDIAATDTATPDTVTTPTGPWPDLVVSPEAVDLSGVCDSGQTEIWLSNMGEGDLILDLVQTTSNWGIDTAVPEALAAETSVELTLLTIGGEGTLTIHSNDPDEPIKDVPLMTRPDGPPVVAIVAPTEGAIIAQGEEAYLYAIVGDEETPTEALEVEWSSDVDGFIDKPDVEADGSSEAKWRSPRTPGDHTLTVTVTDTCGLSASATVKVCQQAGFDESLLDIESWSFAGEARWDPVNDWLELTDDRMNIVGGAFTSAKAVSGDTLEITFLFYIGDGTGADGISLTALNTNVATSYIGGSGCGIGYGGDAPCTDGPALPGWSLEVDTWYNEGQDPTSEDHIMFTFNGDVDDPAAWAILPEMEDNGWHTMRVVVDAPHVLAEIDGVPYIDQNITGGTFDFPAAIGFTAGTGSVTNFHLIDSLVVTDFVCDES